MAKNSEIKRKQWIVIACGITALLALTAVGTVVTGSKEGTRETMPKTMPLSSGVSQAEKDAAEVESQALVAEINSRLTQLGHQVGAIKTDVDRIKNAPPAPGFTRPSSENFNDDQSEVFSGESPFQRSNVPPPPMINSNPGVGISPRGGAGEFESPIETINIGAGPMPGKEGNAVDVFVNDTNAAAQRSAQQNARQRARDSGTDAAIAAFDQGKTYLPAGTYMRAVLLGGLDAPTGGQAQSNPHPVLLQIVEDARLPNDFRAGLRDCMVTGNGYGDIAAERAYIRTDRMSCVREDGGAIDVQIRGYIAGEDGKTGMNGRMVEKTGRILANAFFAAFGSGIGGALENQGRVTSTSAFGTTTTMTGGFREGFGEGVSKAFDKIADYYLKVAESMFPVIEINGGRVVDVVIQQGITIETGTRPL